MELDDGGRVLKGVHATPGQLLVLLGRWGYCSKQGGGFESADEKMPASIS